MKVGIVFHGHPSDGSWSHTRFLRAVGSVLAGQGDDIVAFYPGRKVPGPEAWQGIRTVWVPYDIEGKNSRVRNFTTPRRVRPFLDASFDAVVSTADLGAAALFRRARKLGVLSVDWFQGVAPLFLAFAPPRQGLRDRLGLAGEKLLVPKLEGWHARRADVVIACSQKNRTDLQRLYRVPPERIEVLPNGFDPVPTITPEERARARARLQLEPGVCYASFVGKDWYRKGLDVLQEAVKTSRAEGVPWRILNVGNAVRETPEEIGFGWKDGPEKREVLAASDAFVFPTRFEGSPLPIPEAAALGLPIVTTPDVSVDLGVPGTDYLQVPTGNARALADALRKLAQDPPARREMGLRGQRAFADWTWEKQARELRSIIERGRARLGLKK